MELVRHPANPIIPRDRESTWRQDLTADALCLRAQGGWRLYIRARTHVENQYDADQLIGTICSGFFTASDEEFDGATWHEHPGNPIIKAGPPGRFDDIGTFLGEIIRTDDEWLLFAHSVSHNWEIDVDKGIGRGGKCGTLLTSRDGIDWTFAVERPITAPFSGGHVAALHDGVYHLFYNKRGIGDDVPLVVVRSTDPTDFDESSAELVLDKGPAGAWDSVTVQNPRVWRDGDVWYMIYAGSSHFMDNPHDFGLAASYDLANWVRYPGNPIFSRGEEGQWDDNSIWPCSCVRAGDTWYLYYEGRSCGEPRAEADARATGRGYKGFSQVGLATMKSDVFFFTP